LNWKTVDLRGDSVAVVDLHDGWNIISNPTDKSISWDRIQQANNLSAAGLYSFSGTYERTDTMASARSGKAYYFLNDTEKRELLLPYPGSPAYPSGTDSGKSESPSQNRPTLVLQAIQEETTRKESSQEELTQEEAHTSRIEIQFDENAEEGFGAQDVVAPTTRFSALGFRLQNPRPDAPARRGYLAVERRPELGRGQTFNIRLWSRHEGPVQISRKRIAGLSGAQVSLTSVAEERSYDLTENQSVTLNVGQDTTQFRLAVGNPEYVKDQSRKETPEKLRLTAYPNPTHQKATLKYALPEAATVRISVFDVLGRRIAQVLNEEKRAGVHTAPIDASPLSSGVYFLRMSASGKTKTQKITVVQ
jgi:hypothetical protein